MQIRFLGATRTVTGSSYLVRVGDLQVLVDCGLFQGDDNLSELNRLQSEYNPSSIDYIILTHAHIDHSGLIPRLFRQGFRGQILATGATADLCSIMLPDSGNIQEMEAEWINRKHIRAGREPIEPIYTAADAEASLALFRPIGYGETVALTDNLSVTLYDAGHILGSASVLLTCTEHGKTRKIVFSGDIGRPGQAIIRDPHHFEVADVVLMETTYGDRNHEQSQNRRQILRQTLEETLARGGNLIIPAFSVGRTQELIYELNYLVENRLLPAMPVFIDSPLAVSATEIFRRHPECFDAETNRMLAAGDLPLDFKGLSFTRTSEESKRLNSISGGAVIISASGMCTAGRIKHHLKHNLWKETSTVLFVGYQGKGTLGREILDGHRRVSIFGEEIAVRASIRSISGFSAHADQEELLAWLAGFRSAPEKLFLIHGEVEASMEFGRVVKARRGWETTIPYPQETVEV